jgi:replicative DNA helicase
VTQSRSSRPLPQNLEAEMNVLGGLLLDNQALDVVIEVGLKTEDFFGEKHAIIYRAILELISQSLPADAITVRNALARNGTLPEVGGAPYLAEIVKSDFSIPNIKAYALIVKEKATERKIIAVCTEQLEKAYEGVLKHDEFRRETEKNVLGATSDPKLKTFSPLGDVLMDVFTHLQESASLERKIIGVPSGFRELDKETMGWHPGQLIIVAARPGMGKTSFMLNIALNAAVKGGVGVAVFSMEMTREELSLRLLSMEARVEANRLKNSSRLMDPDWKLLQIAGERMRETPLFLDETPGLNILELKSRSRQIKNKHGLGLVIVDYLQLMRGLGRTSSREQEISEISRGLKAMAKELGVPVIAASQLSREIEKREGGRPKLSDLRESGAIEQDADIVLFIHREKDNPEKRNEAEIIIGKHRSGNLADIRLEWHGQYTTFKDP